MKPLMAALVVFAVIGPASAPAIESSRPTPTGATEIWAPEPGLTLQWQLQGNLDTSIDVDVYNIDMFDNSAATVEELHNDGRKVICYISGGLLGAVETRRRRLSEIRARAKNSTVGRGSDGWTSASIDKLRPIMNERMDKCAAKGFDGIEFDNVDGYTNRTRLPAQGSRHQKRYNRYLARAAHDRGLAAGLKNDLNQIDDLEPHFDVRRQRAVLPVSRVRAARRTSSTRARPCSRSSTNSSAASSAPKRTPATSAR